jgi:ADP-ribosylglycohydrolase
MEHRNIVLDALLGVAVGDTLGVPVEFVSRASLSRDPVTGMRAFGSHGQPAGTWSDDSSLTFCLAEMLCQGYDLQNLANRFVNWKEHGYWSARGQVFDIGIATSSAIHELGRGSKPTLAGGRDEGSNGNGSLMRILPLVFYTRGMEMSERFDHVRDVSCLTHGHIRSVIACFIYTEFALQLTSGATREAALQFIRTAVNDFMKDHPACPLQEIHRFHHILLNPMGNYDIVPLEEMPANELHSSGYVLSTLEAALWCLLKTDSYAACVLEAVNLGSDTDTTAAVAGGLAGILYGSASIPEEWRSVLARAADIEDLANRLHNKLFQSSSHDHA